MKWYVQIVVLPKQDMGNSTILVVLLTFCFYSALGYVRACGDIGSGSVMYAMANIAIVMLNFPGPPLTSQAYCTSKRCKIARIMVYKIMYG